MAKIFARIAGQSVAEVVAVPDGADIAEMFHPDIASAMVEVPGGAVVEPGYRWAGRKFSPPPPPAASVPRSITRRQMLIALAGAGMITPEEALAAATAGAVPARIDAVFARLPAPDALAARVTWATMSVAERDHPLVDALILAGLATAEQVDALFAAAARI